MKIQNKNTLDKYGRYGLLLMLLLAVSIGHYSFSIALAQEQEAKRAKKTMKGVSGEVSGISKDFIAIVYRRDEARGSEEEMAFPVAKDVMVEHKKALSEIGVGDMVDVEFEEAEEETKDGPRTKREVKVVRFIRAAPKQTEPSLLDSGSESGDEPEGQ